VGRFAEKDPIVEFRMEEQYLYVANSPQLFTDPRGQWKVTRDKKPYALAVSEKGDTIDGLAKIAGLEAKEFTRWLRRADKELAKTKAIEEGVYRSDEQLGVGTMFAIPNTVMVFRGPASLEGERKYVTEGQIMDGVEAAWKKWRNEGFHTSRPIPDAMRVSPIGHSKNEIVSTLRSETGLGKLHGFVGIGHTGIGYITVRNSQGKNEDLKAEEIKPQLNYTLGLTVIHGCYSYATAWLEITAPNGNAYGTNKLVRPWEFDALEKIVREKRAGPR
jgi:hypothetical protein